VGKPAHFLYIGDYDKSGLDIDSDIEAKLRRYAPKSEIHFERLAVLPKQIAKWKLPSAPPKDPKKTHAKNFVKRTVEVEAIEPARLRDLVDKAIKRFIDPDELRRLERIEKAETAPLDKMIQSLPKAKKPRY
jgi:hypothetical protein